MIGASRLFLGWWLCIEVVEIVLGLGDGILRILLVVLLLVRVLVVILLLIVILVIVVAVSLVVVAFDGLLIAGVGILCLVTTGACVRALSLITSIVLFLTQFGDLVSVGCLVPLEGFLQFVMLLLQRFHQIHLFLLRSLHLVILILNFILHVLLVGHQLFQLRVFEDVSLLLLLLRWHVRHHLLGSRRSTNVKFW